MRAYKAHRRGRHAAVTAEPHGEGPSWSTTGSLAQPSAALIGYGSVVDLAGRAAMQNTIDTVNDCLHVEAPARDWAQVGEYFRSALTQVDAELDRATRRRVRVLWSDAIAEQLAQGLREHRESGGDPLVQLKLT